MENDYDAVQIQVKNFPNNKAVNFLREIFMKGIDYSYYYEEM